LKILDFRLKTAPDTFYLQSEIYNLQAEIDLSTGKLFPPLSPRSRLEARKIKGLCLPPHENQ